MIPYIGSYYLLHALSYRDWSGRADARQELERMSKHMALCFRDYLYMASLGEARHAKAKIRIGFRGFEGQERDTVFRWSHRYAIDESNLKRLHDLLIDPRWPSGNGGFGGKRWAELVTLAGNYGTMSDVLYVDAVVNAQHNRGTAFSKSEAALYMDIDFTNYDDVSLRSFLDYRQKSPDVLLGFTKHYRHVSLTSGRLFIAYNREDKLGLDLHGLIPLPDKSYKPVKWGARPLPPLSDALY